jgi:hypothetical protein
MFACILEEKVGWRLGYGKFHHLGITLDSIGWNGNEKTDNHERLSRQELETPAGRRCDNVEH